MISYNTRAAVCSLQVTELLKFCFFIFDKVVGPVQGARAHARGGAYPRSLPLRARIYPHRHRHPPLPFVGCTYSQASDLSHKPTGKQRFATSLTFLSTRIPLPPPPCYDRWRRAVAAPTALCTFLRLEQDKVRWDGLWLRKGSAFAPLLTYVPPRTWPFHVSLRTDISTSTSSHCLSRCCTEAGISMPTRTPMSSPPSSPETKVSLVCLFISSHFFSVFPFLF